jgi:hypothetical protein
VRKSVPLKEADLKTFEAYKKAVRQDVTKITNNGKTKFWVYKDVELPLEKTPAKKQKIAGFIALVDAKGIRASAALKGKRLVCLGDCSLEENKVAFTSEKGKVPYNLLKVSVPLFLGKYVHIPAGADAESDTDEGVEDEGEQEQEAPLAPPPPPTAGSNLAAAWAKLVAEVQAAIAANPARKDALAHAAAGIPELIKANATEEATTKMDALRVLLAAPPPPPPPPPSNLAAEWNKLVKELQAAVAANPARKDALAHAAAGIPELIKANATEEATAKMDALRALLAAPPPPPPQTAANLAARWNQLVQELRAAVAANPARKDALSKAAAGIPELIKENKAAEAIQRMDALEAMLAAAPPPANDAAALTARWNALVKRMQTEVAAHPEKKTDLARAAAGIPDMIKGGKLDLAAKLMDGVERLLGQADPRAEEYRTRYAALEKELLEALQDPARDPGRLRAVSAFANEKAEAGDYAAALKGLQQLEEALRTAVEQPTTESEQEEGSEKTETEKEVSLVQFAKLRLQWQQAKQSVAGELAELDKMVRGEMADDPMIGNLQRLAGILKVFNEGLSDALDKLANADTPDKRRAAAEAAQEAADHYIDHIVDDELIEYVEDNPFTETRISGHLLPPLSAISAALGTIGRAN